MAPTPKEKRQPGLRGVQAQALRPQESGESEQKGSLPKIIQTEDHPIKKVHAMEPMGIGERRRGQKKDD